MTLSDLSFLADPHEAADWRLVLLLDVATEAGLLDALPAQPREVATRLDLDERSVRVVLEVEIFLAGPAHRAPPVGHQDWPDATTQGFAGGHHRCEGADPVLPRLSRVPRGVRVGHRRGGGHAGRNVGDVGRGCQWRAAGPVPVAVAHGHRPL